MLTFRVIDYQTGKHYDFHTYSAAQAAKLVIRG